MSCPNFLIIMSDQHSPHALGPMSGGPPDSTVRTPHLDALAQRGVVCANTYSAAPVCVPSRMTFMTAQQPSDIEVWTNSCLLDSQTPTWAHALSLAGYETTLCGRMHFAGSDQHHGFQRRLIGDVSGAMVAGHDWNQLFEGQIPISTTGQSAITHKAIGAGKSTYMAYDEAVTHRACDYLQEIEQAGAERPFCLMVGMLLPHNPYICPRPLFDEYMSKISPDDIALQEAQIHEGEVFAAVHPAIAQLRSYRQTAAITPEQTRRARAAYYGLTTYLDERIGEILAALAATSSAENTVVVYTSDHGEMAGEHGLWWKETFYEGACRVPLIWSYPGHFTQGTRQSHISSLLDIGPTCLDLAGAAPLPLSRGTSLRETLCASHDTGYGEHPAFAETYAVGQRPARMIRSGPWKLNLYHGYDAPQLFNLEADPDELHDQGSAEDHADVRESLLGQVRYKWNPNHIEQVVTGRGLTQRWRHEIKLGESEVWAVPVGSNEFES